MVGLAATSLADYGGTLVSNASFEVRNTETAFADEWWFAPDGVVTYHNPEPNNAHSGEAFVSMVPGQEGWSVCWSSVDIPIASNTTYTIAGFVSDANGGQSGQNPAGAAQFKLEWYANRGDPYDQYLDIDYVYLAVPKDGNYYNFSGQVNNDSDANFVRVILVVSKVADQTRTFNFDDITFARTNPLARTDFNGDGTVNFIDFALLAQGYSLAIPKYDMDGDGSFTVSDLGLFTTDWTRIIPDLPGYHLVWADEFDGIEIDYSKWAHEVGNSWSNGEIQSYTARPYNSYVENGKLVIIARKEQYGPNYYTSARLRSLSKADFRYGRLAARIKLPTGKGIWPAFWMLPTYNVYGNWADNGEIDIMEAINQTDRIYATIHFSDALHHPVRSEGSYYAGGLNFADDFHIYAIEWKPNEIRWFVDDIMYFSETQWTSGTNPYPAPFNEYFHFVLNVAIGGNWPGPPDESTVFPQKMLVDWVRVYQKNPVCFEDLRRLVSEWLYTSDFGSIPEDTNGDGIVNFMDYALLAESWMQEPFL
jgi:beta-glucanase (GH16 family)